MASWRKTGVGTRTPEQVSEQEMHITLQKGAVMPRQEVKVMAIGRSFFALGLVLLCAHDNCLFCVVH